MFNYLSTIERNGVEYKIHDEAIFSCEVLVNGVIAPSFVDALAAAKGDVELKLMKDIVLDAPVFVPAGANIILELNGHIIKAADNVSFAGGLIIVLHGASLTINGEGSIYGFVPGSDSLYAAIQLTHKDYIDDDNAARLVVNGGHITGYYYAICGNGNPGRGNTEIVINNGTLDCITFTGTTIYNPQENSSIIVNGGFIVGANTGIEMRSGNLVVNNGRIESLNAPASVAPNGSGSTAAGSAIAVCQHSTKNPINVEINGGVMRGYHALYQANPQKNDAEAIEKVQMMIMNGSFVAMNSTMPVYSENKTGFIYGGTFSHPVDESYEA